MPLSGLLFAADAFELYVSSSGSGSHTGDGTGKYVHSAHGDTLWCPTLTATATGFDLLVGGNSSDDEWTVTYTGPGAPLGATWTGSGWNSVNAQIIITDLRIYGEGGGFRVTGTVDVFANGVHKLTAGIDESTALFGPAFIPLLGIPWGISGGAAAETEGLPTYAPDDLYSYQSEANATATGGWRWKPVGEANWQTLPIVLPSVNLPEPEEPCQSFEAGEVDADSTWNMTVSSYAIKGASAVLDADGEITECITECFCDGEPDGSVSVIQDTPIPWERIKKETLAKSGGAAIRGVPNTPKAIRRMSSDNRSLLYRAEMPEVKSAGVAICTDEWIADPFDEPGAIFATTHPHQDELLQEVNNSAAPIENTLSYPIYAPVAVGSDGEYYLTYATYIDGLVQCGDPPASTCPGERVCINTSVGLELPPPDEEYLTARSFLFPQSVEALATYLDHSDILPRYINSWANPMWSYFLWQQSWELDGAPETWEDYWQKVGSQHLYNSALSGPSRARNHLVSEPLEADVHAGFLALAANNLRYPGISRWQTKQVTPLTDYTYDSGSETLWNASEGDLTFATKIEIEESGGFAGDIELSLDLGSFAVAPYLWPHLADRITCDWEAANIDNCKVYLEGVEGTRILLNDNQPGVAKVKPTGKATKYAGSWAQDYGAGVTTDQGDDATIDGLSAGVVSPEFACAFQLLADRTATKLVYVITPVDPGEPVVIEYPRLEYTKSAQRKVIPENAHQQAIIHPNGPGVRSGIWDTGTSGTLNNPPSVYDPTERPNIVDWLVTERLLVRGVAHDDGLSAELTARFTTYEGQSVGNTRNFSYGFWLPAGGADWHLALVNSYAECPPLSAFPTRGRSATWDASGDFAADIWIWHQGASYFINPSQLPQLRTSDESTIWSTGSASVDGWAVARHDHAVNNSENDFGIWSQGVKYAEDIRPWRGYFMVLLAESGGDVVLTSSKLSGWMFAAVANSECVSIHRFAPSLPDAPEVFECVVSGDVSSLAIMLSPMDVLIIHYVLGGSAYRIESWSQGEEWSEPTMIASGEEVASAIDPASGIEFVAVWESGTFRCYRSLDLGQTFEHVGDIVSADQARGGLAVAHTAARPLVFVLDGVRRFESTDYGETWAEIG